MLQLAIFDEPGGALLADWSDARECVFRTHQYGFGALNAFVPMRRQDAFRWYNREGTPHMEAIAPSGVVWEGRLEDVALGGDGIRIAAFGYWNALLDVPYTALWSTKSYAPWQVISSETANYEPARYEMDNNNRLWIAPREGERADNTGSAAWYYETPDGGERTITAVSFSYELVAGSSWTAVLYTADRGLTSGGALQWFLTGNGATQSGTQSLTFTGEERIYFTYGWNNALAGTFTGATGSNYLRITNLRVKTTTAAAVYADAIANDLIAHVNGVNATQLSAVTALVDSPGLDLQEEVYEDEYPADILTRLVALGDDQTPPARWEVGVWEDQKLHMRERGSEGRTWYVDLSELEIERSLNEMRNSAYAVYSDANNITQRTATADDDTSIDKYELTRRAAVKVSTTSDTQAQTHRDAFLEDRKEPVPRAWLEFGELYTEGGARVPLYAARSGDTIIARNLPPTLSVEIDRLRSFRLAETEYDCDSGRLAVVPEMPLATLETLVARREEGF